jgi:enterochelin esterase-like enzyme
MADTPSQSARRRIERRPCRHGRWWVIGVLVLLGLGAMAACSRPSAGGRTQTAPTDSSLTNSPTPFTSVAPTASATALPPSATPTPTCLETQGKVVQDTYPALNVQGDVPIMVYLPPCYTFQTSPHPVMYLFHGKPFNEQHWVDLGIVQTVEDRPGDPSESHWVIVMPRVPEPLFSNSDGGPASYEGEFTQALIPYIESTYNVRSDREGRVIGGISRGGVWSLEIGLSHPELFDTVVALSPALAVNSPRPAYDPFTLVETASVLPAHIFLGAGDDDWARPETLRLIDRLERQGAHPQSALVPGSHAAATWEALMPQMLSFADQSLGPSEGLP